MNCFEPPPTNDTIKVLSGMAGPGKQPLNNLNQFWLENVKLLNKGDIMLCGGDFVQAASSDACFPTQPKKDPSVLKTTVSEAASWNINPDYNRACSTKEEIDSCKGIWDDADGTKDMNSGSIWDSDCICPCIETEYTSKYPVTNEGIQLIEETKKAMDRGAKIVFLDNYFMIATVYPDNKAGHDFVFSTLQNYSNNMKSTTKNKGGGFYWFQWGQSNIKTQGYNSLVTIHSKICAFFFIGERQNQKPWLTCSLGSFNPSFPISLTLEIATCVTGLLSNNFINGVAHLMFDVFTVVINEGYAPQANFNSYYKGEVWNSTKGSGYSQGGCPNYEPNDTNPLHCTIPPTSNTDQYGFIQPWVNIATSLGINTKSSAKWWANMPEGKWKNSYYPIYGEKLFNSASLTTDVIFCGMEFCNKNIQKSKYHDVDEQRITFTEKNVQIKIGAEPTGLFPRFNYGIVLINELFANASKYVKIGIMNATFSSPANSLNDPNWLLGPKYIIPPNPASNNQKPTTGKFLEFAQKGLPLYVMEKNIHSPKCAFKCVNGVCQKESLQGKTYITDSECFDAWGNMNTKLCSSSSNCNGLSCGKTIENYRLNNYTSNFETLKSESKNSYCDFIDKQDYINILSNSYLNQDRTGYSYYPQILPIFLKGFNSVGGINRESFLAGNSEFKSKVENGTLKPVSVTNPYPLFYKTYKSGLHWKFYMSDKDIIFSTQHLVNNMFYGFNNYSSLGYDIKWSNCPGMVDYYDQLYNWFWENQTFDEKTYDSSYKKDNGYCYQSANPNSTIGKNGCGKNFSYSNQKYLPPICRTDNCCEIQGAQQLNGPCYPGGKYKEISPSPPGPIPSPPGPIPSPPGPIPKRPSSGDGSNQLSNIILNIFICIIFITIISLLIKLIIKNN